MTTQTLEQIETRVSANLFDPAHHLTEAQIGRLIDLATRAPTAYNLQNWRFVAVRSDAEKARLKDLANGQQKVADAAVTFVVFGVLPDAATLGPRLRPSVDAEIMPGGMATTVSARSLPYAAMLDGWLKRQGMRSSMALFGWPSRIARRVSAM